MREVGGQRLALPPHVAKLLSLSLPLLACGAASQVPVPPCTIERAQHPGYLLGAHAPYTSDQWGMTSKATGHFP